MIQYPFKKIGPPVNVFSTRWTYIPLQSIGTIEKGRTATSNEVPVGDEFGILELQSLEKRSKAEVPGTSSQIALHNCPGPSGISREGHPKQPK